MPDIAVSFWKRSALALLVAIIGVYALYDWYGDRLRGQLTSRDAELAELRGQCATLEQDGAACRTASAALRAQLDQAARERQAREQAWELERADQAAALAAGQARIAEIEAAWHQALAVQTALESAHTAAQNRIAALEGDLSRIQEVIARSTAAHQAQVEQLQRHLNERIALATVTPADAELIQTARTLGLLTGTEAPGDTNADAEPAPTDPAAPVPSEMPETVPAELETTRAALAQARSELETTQAALTQAQADLETARAELAESRNQLARLAAERDDRRAALERMRTEHETARAALDTRLAAVASERDEARAALAGREAACTQGETERAQALDAARARIAALTAELDEARRTRDGQAAALTETLNATRARLADAERALDETRRQSAQLETRIRAETGAELEALRRFHARLAELGARHTERGMLLRLADSEVRFQTGQATLPATDLPSLDRIAALASEQPGARLRIEGHTDSLGNPETNRTLSRQRAEAVMQALIARGVDGARVSAEGLGAAHPLADNATASGRAQNRRVEIYVTGP